MKVFVIAWDVLSKSNLKEREQRKRVAAIISGMLVAREINATELLSDIDSERSQRTIATAIVRAQTILTKMADTH